MGEGGDPSLSFLYFLFCIIENLGDLTNIPNSIFCKFSILEHSCAQQGACAHLYCMYVDVCWACMCMCMRARACVGGIHKETVLPPASTQTFLPSVPLP